MMRSLLIAAALAAVPCCADNLLKNGDFEDGFTAWRMDSPIPAAIDSQGPFAGKKACRMLNIPKKVGEIRQPFTPVAGKAHRLRFAWKGQSLAPDAAEVRILLFRENEKGRKVPWHWAEYKRSIHLQKRGGTFDWKEADILLDGKNFPQEVKQAVLYFKLNHPEQGTLLIDNVSISPVEDSGKNAASPVPPPPQSVPKNGSLLANGDFSSGISGWNWNGKKCPVETAGANGVKISLAANAAGELRTPFKPEKGRDHILEFQAKCETLSPASAEFRILLFTRGEGKSVKPMHWAVNSGGNIKLIVLGGTAGWKKYQVRIPDSNFPDEVVHAVLYLKWNSTSAGTLHVREIKLRADPASGTIHADASVQSLWPEDGSFETGNRFFPLAPTEKAAWHGKRSLRMPPEVASFDSAYLPVELVPDTSYYCMAFLRGDRAGTVTIHLSSNTFQTLCTRRIAMVPGQWQKVLLKIPPRKNGGVFKIAVSKTPGMELLLDAFSLYRGRAVPEDYRSSSPFFAGTDYLTTPGEVFFPEEKPLNRTVRLFNASGEKRTVRYRIQLLNLQGGTESIAAGTRILLPGENAAVVCSSSRGLPPGYYVLRIESESGSVKRSDDFPFLVANHPEQKGKIGFACIHPMGPRVVGGRNGNHPVSPAALSRIGVKGVRDFIYRYGADFRNGQWKLPADIRILDYAGCNMDTMLSVQNAVDRKKIDSPADAAAFYRALMDRCGKDIRFWEVENEPDLGWKPFCGPRAAECYGQYAKELTALLRTAGKGDKICGPGISGEDFLHDGMPFLRTASRQLGKAFDGITIHPYTGMRFLGRDQEETTPEANRTYERLLAAKKCLLQEGASLPLWCSEVGYALDLSEPCTGKTAKRHADYVARLLLLSRAAGVESLYYFTADGCVERLHFHYGLWRGGTILPAAGAFAEAARHLERSRIDRIFENCDLHIMTFRHELTGKLFCALWSSSGKEYPVRLQGKPSEYQLTDLFGASVPLRERSGKVELSAASSPVYLESRTLTAEAFRMRIAKAEKDFPPVKMSIRVLSRNQVMVLLRNLRGREVNGICRFAGAEQRFTLPAKGEKKLLFSAASAGKAAEVSVLAENFLMKENVKMDFQPCPHWKTFTLMSKELPPDGRLPELDSFRYILPPDPSVCYKGPEDLSIRSAAGYDETYLYLAIDVRDDVHCQTNSGARLFAGDSIQLAVDTLANAVKGESYDRDDYEFSFGLSSDGKRMVNLDYLYEAGRRDAVLKSLQYRIFRDGSVCCYRIAIPWRSLKFTPAPGKIIGLNFIANDNDGFGRRFWMGPRPGIGEEKAPWRYLRFELLPERTPSRPEIRK